jgi:hypothetical protein
VRCGAARAGAAARSLFGLTGGSSALADPKTISAESKQTQEMNALFMRRPVHARISYLNGNLTPPAAATRNWQMIVHSAAFWQCVARQIHQGSHRAAESLEIDFLKRLGSRYRSGHSPDRLKFKNPEALAVKREAEEDWGRYESDP